MKGKRGGKLTQKRGTNLQKRSFKMNKQTIGGQINFKKNIKEYYLAQQRE